jgi:hypothetical protein
VDSIWHLVAFCGRYGHQPLGELLSRPMSELSRFAEALQSLIEKESASPFEQMATGG